jgi:hypothetical protein
LIGGIQCLLDDAWFYDVACVGSLKWVLVYCGSYICNNISCLVGFLFCTSHILAIFLCFNSLEDNTRRKLKADVSGRKEDFTLPSFPPCAFFCPTYLTLMKTPATNKEKDWGLHTDQQKRTTVYLPWEQCFCLSPSSLLLLSSNLGTRFRLRGVDLSHPEISNFRMWIERIIK